MTESQDAQVRVEESEDPGPLKVIISLLGLPGKVRVIGADVTRTHIELRPVVPGSKLALDAIAKAVVTSKADRMIVKVGDFESGSSRTVIQTSGGVTDIGNARGVVIASAGSMRIDNGRITILDDSGSVVISDTNAVLTNDDAVEIVATVPSQATAEIITTVADVEMRGRLHILRVAARTGNTDVQPQSDHALQSLITDTNVGDVYATSAVTAECNATTGNVTIQQAVTVDTETSTGNVHIGNARNISARTRTGNIHIDAVTNRLRAQSNTGNITATTFTEEVQARTNTGNITLTGKDVTLPARAARSSVGRVHIR